MRKREEQAYNNIAANNRQRWDGSQSDGQSLETANDEERIDDTTRLPG